MKQNILSSDNGLESFTPRICALGLIAVLLLLALTGCKNEPSSTSTINPVGVYTLVSVDGKTVPCELKHEGVTMLVKSGDFTINADQTCRSQSTFAVPPHPDSQREVTANYTQHGTELTMKWQGAGTTKGQLAGNEFRMNNEGMIFSYRRAN